MSKEKTVEEIRNEFLNHIASLVEYWDKTGKNKKDALEGLAFSIMSTLDGTSIGIPSFIVAPLPHSDDKQYHINNNEDFYPQNDEEKINGDIAGSLHELIGKYFK